MAIEDVLQHLPLESLQKLLVERKAIVGITARLVAERPHTDVVSQWEHESAMRAVQAVEAEIAKRTGPM